VSGALAVPLAVSVGQTDRISGVALGAALLVLAVALALALVRWNDDELPPDDELLPVERRRRSPLERVPEREHHWRDSDSLPRKRGDFR
jgi:hypothetical protein